MRKHGQGPAALGWQVSMEEDYTGTRRLITLILPAGFPVAPPFVLVEPSAYLKWPHCERDGKLCLWVTGRAPVGMSAERVVEHVFERIGRALQYALPNADSAERQKEFEREWLSYWPAANPNKVRAGITILMLDVPVRETALYAKLVVRPGARPQSGKRVLRPWFPLALVSSKEDLLQRWSARFTLFDDDRPLPVALYAPLRRPLPIGMPPSTAELRTLLSAGAGQLLDRAISDATPKRPVWLILSAEFDSGMAMAGVELQPRQQPTPPQPGQYRSQREARHAHANVPVTWMPQSVSVMRADPSWMLDRGVSEVRARLLKARVLVVGGGALGGIVAEGLMRAGVGHMTLVDPDRFDAANVGRHVLGATSIGQYKAEAMTEHLAAAMPQIDVVPVLERIEEAPADVVDLARFDLIIYTTADWPSELHLISRRQGRAKSPPLLLSWVEPRGVAGHGVLSLDAEDKLQSLFTPEGDFHHRFSEWPDGVGYRLLPACQATFQPAALLDIQPVGTMVAAMAIDFLTGSITTGQLRSWWTEPSYVTKYGGDPTVATADLQPNAMHQRELASLLTIGS